MWYYYCLVIWSVSYILWSVIENTSKEIDDSWLISLSLSFLKWCDPMPIMLRRGLIWVKYLAFPILLTSNVTYFSELYPYNYLFPVTFKCTTINPMVHSVYRTCNPYIIIAQLDPLVMVFTFLVQNWWFIYLLMWTMVLILLAPKHWPRVTINTISIN